MEERTTRYSPLGGADENELSPGVLQNLSLVAGQQLDDPKPHTGRSRRRNVFVSALGSFSTAYNIVNFSLVQIAMSAVYPLSDAFASAVAASMFAGMVVGQLGFGFVGDAVGLVPAFRLTMVLQVIGAIGSASVAGSSASVYTQLLLLRFLLGVGAGGIYPLSAVFASNSSDKGSSDTTVAFVFSMQGVAFVTFNVLATILAYTTSNHNFIFRLLLGLGAVPGLVILSLSIPDVTTVSGGKRTPHVGATARTIVAEVLRNRRMARRLLGCSLTWFLYDVCFFGNTIFAPIIVDNIFGGGSSFREECRSSLIVACVGLPGYFIAVALMRRLGPRFIQVQGFVMTTLLYLILAVFGTHWIRHGLGGLVLVLYGLSFTFFNFGPGATTFLFPSKLFPVDVKSSLNGIAAAAGKIGGFLGSSMFEPLLKKTGVNVVLYICAVLAALGAISTVILIDPGADTGAASLAVQPAVHVMGNPTADDCPASEGPSPDSSPQRSSRLRLLSGDAS